LCKLVVLANDFVFRKILENLVWFKLLFSVKNSLSYFNDQQNIFKYTSNVFDCIFGAKNKIEKQKHCISNDSSQKDKESYYISFPNNKTVQFYINNNSKVIDLKKLIQNKFGIKLNTFNLA